MSVSGAPTFAELASGRGMLVRRGNHLDWAFAPPSERIVSYTLDPYPTGELRLGPTMVGWELIVFPPKGKVFLRRAVDALDRALEGQG